jgi:hypothetical protein
MGGACSTGVGSGSGVTGFALGTSTCFAGREPRGLGVEGAADATASALAVGAALALGTTGAGAAEAMLGVGTLVGAGAISAGATCVRT